MPRTLVVSLSLVALLVCACDGMVGELGMNAAENPPGGPPAAGVPHVDSFDCSPGAGAAPLNSLCAIHVSHPDHRPLRCTVSVDDGRPLVLDSVACDQPLTQGVLFPKAGNFGITLTVKDDLGANAQQTDALTVTETPDQPPVVTSFTAAPASGGAPLNTTFTWAVSDPDPGDVLTCSIDVGNDGTVEYPALDCGKLTQAYTLATASSVDVLFVVKDSKGQSASAKLTLTARAPVGDVKISKVEWGQSVVSPTLRLVEGKSALLRIHVLGDKAGLTGVTVDAEGFTTTGTSLGKLPLVGPASPPTAEVPADLKQQWTATVPAAWIEVGLEIRVKVDPLDALPETDETNNAQSVKPVVGKGNVLALTSVPVVMGGGTATPFDAQPIMTRIWPLKAVANTTRAPYTFSGTLAAGDTGGWSNLLQDMASVRQSDGSSNDYYGFVKVGYGSGIAGIGYINQGAATGRDDSTETLAHELGHNLGRQHAPCGGAASPDPGFPYAGAKIGSWGYDATNKALLNPATYLDLMGYCQPEWVSDYNYKAVQTALEAGAYIPPQGPAMYVPVLLVSGVIHRGEVMLRPVHRMLAPPTPNGDGPWAIRLRAADGTESLRSFTPSVVADADEQLHFTLLLPDPGALQSLEVLHGLEVVSRQVALGGEAPVPSLTRVAPNLVRLFWDARRFATAEVAHLGDDGTRTTLALSLTHGDALIRTDGLEAGRFEVSLSDGLTATRRELVASGR